jgi:hypothetical protein
MTDNNRERPTARQVTTTVTPTTSRARYVVGPSKGRSNADASAPGVAEALGHQGVPEPETTVDADQSPSVRSGEAAALRRVARRRQRMNVQRKERVDVRYSVEEKERILTEAGRMGIAGAHFVGAVVMSYLDGNLGLVLPGQRTRIDDYIDDLAALRAQVAHIGRNVNQIAKALNSGGHPHAVDSAVLAQAERTLTTAGATVADIDRAAYHAATGKAAA